VVPAGGSLHHSPTAVATFSATPIVDGCDIAVASTSRIRPAWVTSTPLEHHRSGDQQDRRQRASIEPCGHRWSQPCRDRKPFMGHDQGSLLLPVNGIRMGVAHGETLEVAWLVEANSRWRSLIVGNSHVSSKMNSACVLGRRSGVSADNTTRCHLPTCGTSPTSQGPNPTIALPARRSHWYATGDGER
jgi:hypothetical protein